MREHDTLRFDLTDDDLTFAIDTLKDRHPELICHRAWQIITNEQERRRVAKWFTKFHIDISVSAYAELPAEVRARFDARKRPRWPCRSRIAVQSSRARGSSHLRR